MTSLPARLAVATGPDRSLDREIGERFGWRPLGYGYWIKPDWWEPIESFEGLPYFTRSIDAAVALVERVLPEWHWLVHGPRWGLPHEASLTEQKLKRVVVGNGQSAPLALLQAMFMALDAKAVHAPSSSVGNSSVDGGPARYHPAAITAP